MKHGNHMMAAPVSTSLTLFGGTVQSLKLTLCTLVTLLDGRTQITLRLDGNTLLVTAVGLAHSLAQHGEQLAWVAAALWPPVRDVVGYHIPSIVPRHLQHDPVRTGPAPICFDILVEESSVPPVKDCWSDSGLVGPNSVVVCGFPVPRQPDTCFGLEVSYMMLQGAGYQLTGLGSTKICLHGPGRPLGLVKERDGVFIWADIRCFRHTCSAVDDSECDRDEEGAISRTKLIPGRHIVVGCGSKNGLGTTKRGEARLRRTDGNADVNRSSGMNKSGLSKLKKNGVLRIDMGQRDAMPSSSDVQMDLVGPDQTPCSTNTPFESDLLSVSDLSESMASLDRRDPVMPSLRAAIVSCLVSGYQSYQACFKTAVSGSGTTGPTSNNAATASTSTGASRTGRSKEQAKKHHLRASGDDDDSPSQPPPGKRAKVRRSCEPRKSVLACPFWKADPNKYCSCFDRLLNRISDVKQHLARVHRPKLYCERCSMIFSTEESRQQHVSNPAGLFCVPSAQLDGISHHQQIQISRKSNRNLSQEQQWFALWDIVFPDRDRPSSAYRTFGISEDLYSFREYCATRSESILEAEAQRMVDNGRWSEFGMVSGEQRREIMRWLARDGFDLAFGEWILTRPSPTPAGQSASGVVLAHATPVRSSLPEWRSSWHGAAGERASAGCYFRELRWRECWGRVIEESTGG